MTQLQTYLTWLEARGQKFPFISRSVTPETTERIQESHLETAPPETEDAYETRLVVFCNSLLDIEDYDFLSRMHRAVKAHCGNLEVLDRSNPHAFELLKDARKRGDLIILMLLDSSEDVIATTSVDQPSDTSPLTLTAAKIDVIKTNISEKRRFWHQLQRFLKIQTPGPKL